MSGVTAFAAGGENPSSSEGEPEINQPAEQKPARPRLQIEADAERIRSAVARLTSSSVDGLEGLASELQQLQVFLKSEVERVQTEIEGALAGISIIIETIAPWKTMSVPAANPSARPVRAGPAANLEPVQARR